MVLGSVLISFFIGWHLFYGMCSCLCNIFSHLFFEDMRLFLVFLSKFNQFSHSVVSYSLQPHGLKYTWLHYPSPSPGVGSNSCPLNQLHTCLDNKQASLVAQMIKNLPAMQETQIWSMGQEDPLKKEMATHCSVLAWRIPRTEEPDKL